MDLQTPKDQIMTIKGKSYKMQKVVTTDNPAVASELDSHITRVAFYSSLLKKASTKNQKPEIIASIKKLIKDSADVLSKKYKLDLKNQYYFQPQSIVIFLNLSDRELHLLSGVKERMKEEE